MRALETKVAQAVNSSLAGSVEVRVGEQLETIPKDKVVVVNLDSKRPKNPAFSDVFENIFKIELRMHYADQTEQEMETAGDSIQHGLMTPNLWNTDDTILYHQINESKKFIKENYWMQEFSYLVLAVDKES